MMSVWQSSDIESNGIRMHYTRTGGDKPPVVLAHGFSDDGLCWTPVAEALAQDYDLVMVDARGHGQSDAPEHGYDLATMAGDLRGVIVGLGLQRPAVLGHSMGGGTALALAGLYPDVPGAILLEDAGPLGMAGMHMPNDAGRRERINRMVAETKDKTRGQLIAEQHAATPTWSEAELGPWADAKLRLSPNVVEFDPTAAVDWPAVLRRITCPALLIAADPERGGMITTESAAAFQRLVPHLHVVHVAGAGHNVRREQLARYMQIIRAFLAEWAET
jgi:N-formylmaleamate deformylase